MTTPVQHEPAERPADALAQIARRLDALPADRQEEFLRRLARTGISFARLPILPGRRPDRLPLSHAQRRLWVLWQLDRHSRAYHIPMGLSLTGSLDREALAGAFADILARHEVLRTSYPACDGEAEQRIHPAAPRTSPGPICRPWSRWNGKPGCGPWPKRRRQPPSIWKRHRRSACGWCGWRRTSMRCS